MLKTCQFKTWCNGDKSNTENSRDHFCKDTRLNTLAALTNLGHVTPCNCLDTSLILLMQHTNVFMSLCVPINASHYVIFWPYVAHDICYNEQKCLPFECAYIVYIYKANGWQTTTNDGQLVQ